MKKYLVDRAWHRFVRGERAGRAGELVQSPQCGQSARVRQPDQSACRTPAQQAVDVFQFMAPQLGLALAGGNATLGQGGALGGFGHFASACASMRSTG